LFDAHDRLCWNQGIKEGALGDDLSITSATTSRSLSGNGDIRRYDTWVLLFGAGCVADPPVWYLHGGGLYELEWATAALKQSQMIR
jgi:hypothetical protein